MYQFVNEMRFKPENFNATPLIRLLILISNLIKGFSLEGLALVAMVKYLKYKYGK